MQINIYLYPTEGAHNRRKASSLTQATSEKERCCDDLLVLHCHVAVWAAVSKGAPLFLEGDEVPYSHHGVIRHIEVKQFHTRKGFESTQLTRRAGEVLGHKKAICKNRRGENLLMNICEDK